MSHELTCCFCNTPLKHVFADLGASPLSNAYLRSEQLREMEPYYPLTVYVCDRCFLVQLPAVQTPDHIFTDYAYFSSYSESWLKHASDYADAMTSRFGLSSSSLVVELASNDGYLLQYFHAKQIPVLGVEPAANVAKVAIEKRGIPSIVKFFGVQTATEMAAEGASADLLAGNNVLAHVPDLNDFVAGMKILLKPTGVITMEFPHLLQLMLQNQFDTIYHEHFSYFSFLTVEQVFAKHGLTLFDVEELPTHGGSLRIFGRHSDSIEPAVTPQVVELKRKEQSAGLGTLEAYSSFGEQVRETKRKLLDFLISAKRAGKTVVGYGAPAKGNTLLNYCGVKTDFLDYTVDRSPYKQGLFLPGTHIPIYSPDKIRETHPDYLLILPWNLKHEIVSQMAYIREWGGKLVMPIPSLEILD